MQRLRQTAFLDGLEKVVNGIQFECLDRVLVVSSNEDHMRDFNLYLLVQELANHSQTVLPRHRDIQEEDVGFELLDEL